MIIDFQIHFEPEEEIRPHLGPGDSTTASFATNGKSILFASVQRFDVARHIQAMDEAGVDVAALSSMTGQRSGLHKCRVVNDRAKMWEERFPTRIKPMAHIPPLGGEEALAELRRCREELGFRGAAMGSSVRGTDVDDKALWPFYEKLCELGMFLFIHPGYPKYAFEDAGPYYDLARSAAREGHLQMVLVRLINGGVLDDFPQLKVVFSHLGGGFAANLARIISYQDKQFWGSADYPHVAKRCKREFVEYLSMMYFDTGGVIGDTDAIKMALRKLSPKNIVFGTDYPIEIRDGQTIRRFIQGIRGLPLSPPKIEGILGENGRGLVGV